MIRLLVVEGSGDQWGSERALLDLLPALDGVQSAVCCPPERPIIGKLRDLGIPTFPYFVYGLHEKTKVSRLVALAGLLRACFAFKPDVLYLNQSGCYRIAAVAAKLLRIPIVAHVRIFEDAGYLARNAPRPARLRSIIAISRAIEQEIRRHPALEPVAVHTIYDGYAPGHAMRAGSARVDRRIACAGRIVPIKGQDVLLDAVKILRDAGSPVSCVMAGTGGAFRDRLIEQTRNDGLQDDVQWIGFCDDVVGLLGDTSVLVCSSHREPLGRVIFEAWEAGAVPVAFAGSGGAAEVIDAAGAGILYAEQTPASLAEAIERALSLPAVGRAALVANGRTWMQNNCAPDEYARKIASILQAAVQT